MRLPRRSRERQDSIRFEALAINLARVTHGYLTVETFHRYLHQLLDAEEPIPSISSAEGYLGFYGFRKVSDPELIDSYRDSYPWYEDDPTPFYHPKIGDAYTFNSLPRSRIQKISEWWRASIHLS